MDQSEWDRRDHPVEIIYPSSPAEWRDAMTPYFGGGRSNAPINRCLDVVTSNGAHTLVVERPYFDADHRSEHSTYFSQLHESVSSITHRLHFFGERIVDRTRLGIFRTIGSISVTWSCGRHP